MLRQRPTYEEILKEAMTSRLRILPERQKRTQQGILLDDVDFDFDLSRYGRKEIALNNPEKGTQTDLFDNRSSTETSQSIKSVEKEYTQSIEVESEPTQAREPDREREEPERPRGKSMMHRLYDAMFGEDDASASSGRSLDEYKEEREELRNRRQQIEQEEEQIQEQIEEEKDASSDASRGSRDLPMNVKKSYEPSSSSSSRRSSTNRSVLLPIEDEALSEYIQSSPPVSVQSSLPSNRTIEYVEEQTPPQSIISSRRSQETIEYIRSRSSRSTST